MSTDVTSEKPGRQGIPGARSPFPLIDRVPALLADDPLVDAFLAALDEVWAPIISTLDCFDAYLDPQTAPPDMVSYLGSWVLAPIDGARTEDDLRHDVTTAHSVAAWNGTGHLLQSRLVPREAEQVEISDPSGIFTSTTPTDPMQWPEADEPMITVTVTNPTVKGAAGRVRLTKIIRDLVPAHVAYVVLVTGDES